MKKYGFIIEKENDVCGFCDDYDAREAAELDGKYYSEKENAPYRVFEYEA